MKTGNGLPAATAHGPGMPLRDGGKQLRDIEELVAKLRVVTKQLAFPVRTMPVPRAADTAGRTDEAAGRQAGTLSETGETE